MSYDPDELARINLLDNNQEIIGYKNLLKFKSEHQNSTKHE